MKHYSLFLTIGLGCLLALGAESADAQEPQRPNVLMIVIDDQNDWVGCLDGHPLAKTPYIDQLAARGTLFSNAHCQAPLCNPSRTSVLTGLRPSSTGIYSLQPQHWSVDEFRDTLTIPRALQAVGYSTAAVGKVYHGQPADEALKVREFNNWGPGATVGAKPDKRLIPETPPHNNPLMDWGVFEHRDEDKGDSRTTDWALDYLSNNRSQEQPFFLAVGYSLPHVPCYVTQSWYDQFPDSDSLLPPVLMADRTDTPRFSWYLHWSLPEPRLAWLKANNQWHNLCRSYLASTTFVDAQIGRLLGKLEEQGLAENTLVVLWSDHGYHLGEKEITGKNSLWERSTRVPLIFAGPGVTSNQVCKSPVELLDIFPTLVEVLELPKVEHLEGHSLDAQLQEAGHRREWPAITTHNHGNHAVRSATHRYIQYADGTQELYDLQSDPNEWYNLIGKRDADAIAAEMKKFLPQEDRVMVPDSRHRTLQYDQVTDTAIWEGQPINREDPIPEQ